MKWTKSHSSKLYLELYSNYIHETYDQRLRSDHGRILKNLRRSADSARTAGTKITASATETTPKRGKAKVQEKAKMAKPEAPPLPTRVNTQRQGVSASRKAAPE
jgi:hypothetical protein